MASRNPINLPCFKRIDGDDHRLRSCVVDVRYPDGTMVVTRLPCGPTLLSPWTGTALRRLCCIAAIAMGPHLLPTRFTRAPLSLRARGALRRGVVQNICPRTLRFPGALVPFLDGTAGSTVANMRSRARGIHLCVGTGLQRLCAMVMAVGAPYGAGHKWLREPTGVRVGWGSRQPRRAGGHHPGRGHTRQQACSRAASPRRRPGRCPPG
jgi:hypothetical protein